MDVFDGLKRQDAAALRIDWFGNVGNSLRFGPEQRTLKVSCSLWRPGLGWMLGTGDEREEIEIPIAILPHVRLGDVWKDGSFVESSPLTRSLFQDLEVDEQTTEVLPSGLPYSPPGGPSSYVLPFNAFNVHRDHTRSWIARIQVDPSTVLVVPSLEMFRFYFGATGSVLESVMSGGDAEQRLYHAAYISRASNAANIVLGMGMPAAAAPTVARIALDDEAKKAFFTLVKGGRIAGLNKTDWQPRMGFPFTGKTNLTVDGLWLDTPGQRTFVALRVIRCTYPHPFERLYYSIDDGQPKPRVSPERNERQTEERKARPKIVNQGADKSQAALEVYQDGDDSDPFPYLKQTSIHRSRRAAVNSFLPAAEAAESSQYAIGPEDGSGLAPAQIMSAQRARDDGDLEPSFLAELRKAVPDRLPGWELDLFPRGFVARRGLIPPPPDASSWGARWVWVSVLVRCDAQGYVEQRALLAVGEVSNGSFTVEAAIQLLGPDYPAFDELVEGLYEPFWASHSTPATIRETDEKVACWTTHELNKLADELTTCEIAGLILGELKRRARID
ncbi:UNVERIFIED_ORG: hypothetical protein J2W38_005336 [Variovorax paradoxus]|nr:hypothetical protein [Variovorax paradoxus]